MATPKTAAPSVPARRGPFRIECQDGKGWTHTGLVQTSIATATQQAKRDAAHVSTSGHRYGPGWRVKANDGAIVASGSVGPVEAAPVEDDEEE